MKLLFAAALALGSCSAPKTIHLQDQTPHSCQEDDPCWNCLTMGNRQCGHYPEVTVKTDPDGHISVFLEGNLIGWGDLRQD